MNERLTVLTTHNSEYSVAVDKLENVLNELRQKLHPDEVNHLLLCELRKTQRTRDFSMACSVETTKGTEQMVGGGLYTYVGIRYLLRTLRRDWGIPAMLYARWTCFKRGIFRNIKRTEVED